MPSTLHPNLAADSSLRLRVEASLLPRLQRIRDDRSTYTDTWLRYWNIWSSERDANQAYVGRSKTYLSIGRRIIENWVQKLKISLFPNDEWHSVIALREAFEQRVPVVRALNDYFLRKYMSVERKSGPYLRQLVTLGTSPSSTVWRYDSRVLPVLKDVLDSDGNLTGRQIRSLENVIDYIGPTFRLVDLFSWYIDPVTVLDVNDASVIFEDMLLPVERLIAMAASPINPDDESMGVEVENIREVLALEPTGPETKDKFSSLILRLQRKGFSRPSSFSPKNAPFDCTAVWVKADYDDTGLSWWRISVVADKVITKIQKNPFWIGTTSYLAGKFIEVQSEFYGRALPEVFAPMQYFLNDVANQSNDALVWCMNPISVVDAYKVQDPQSIRMRPGAKWLADPEAVKFMEPPKETPSIGFQATAQIIALMNDVSNVAALGGAGSGPRVRGKAVNTATGASILQQENAVQVIDVVRNLEQQVFIPLLRMTHGLSVQCLADPLLLRIVGSDGASMVEKKLTASDIAGDFDFNWLGSTATSNREVQTAQLLNFLQIVTRVPPQLYPNITIDFSVLLKTIYTSMGLRNASQIIKENTRKITIDPRVENDLILVGRGEEVAVSMTDNDQEHIQVHSTASFNSTDLWVRGQFENHIQQHQISAQAKQMMLQQRQLQQLGAPGMPSPGNPTQPQGLSPSGLPPAPGGMPGPTPLSPGNPTPNPSRMRQTNDFGDAMRATPRGPQLLS